MLDDNLGHGTFVAGVIASQDECLGFAPDAEIHSYRVFTNKQMSYTSWFLDAFNYAIFKKVNIINLSIGGPDFMDRPFVEKVLELSANGILMVSAIGNDGPLYGTLNNPADQADVIGVGGIDYEDHIAPFSSRGMTTWELPGGYGRVKPDLVAYSTQVKGSRIYGGCRSLSGTSVASPVVAGAITLLSSVIPESRRTTYINPASIKQALLHSAIRINNANIFEQGFGKLNLLGAYGFLLNYTPKVMVSPDSLDLTDCPYMWPYCKQPLYHSAMPIIVNMTIHNAIAVSSVITEAPEWRPDPHSIGGGLLDIQFTYSKTIWPWTGWLAAHFTVGESGADFEGTAEGSIVLHVVSKGVESSIAVPVKVMIVPQPPRSRRLLWDQYHNLRYPPGFFPRDSLQSKASPLDWHGDHPHTNFHDLFNYLREQNYYLEVLGQPYTCFNAELYGSLLIVDPEEEEIDKLEEDVLERGLSVVVFAEWYNEQIMEKIRFFDENTHMLWTPQTGGANIPALNKLLGRFGAAFSDRVFGGSIQWDVGGDAAAAAQAAAADGAADPGASDNVKGSKFSYASGSSLAKFPADGLVLTATLKDELLFEINNVNKRSDNVPILGLAQTGESSASGRLVAFGDSACIDSSQIRGGKTCFWLLSLMLDYANRNLLDNTFYKLGRPFTTLSSSSLGSFSDSDEANGSSAGAGAGAPDVGRRRSELGEYEFAQLSKVFGRSLPQCATVEQEAAELQMSSATAYVDGDAVVFWKEDQYRGAGGVHWPLPSLPLGHSSHETTVAWSIRTTSAIMIVLIFVAALAAMWLRRRPLSLLHFSRTGSGIKSATYTKSIPLV